MISYDNWKEYVYTSLFLWQIHKTFKPSTISLMRFVKWNKTRKQIWLTCTVVSWMYGGSPHPWPQGNAQTPDAGTWRLYHVFSPVENRVLVKRKNRGRERESIGPSILTHYLACIAKLLYKQCVTIPEKEKWAIETQQGPLARCKIKLTIQACPIVRKWPNCTLLTMRPVYPYTSWRWTPEEPAPLRHARPHNAAPDGPLRSGLDTEEADS